MSVLSASANDVVRRAYLKLDPAVVLAAADAVDLRTGTKISAVVGMPLRSLQQKRDVVSFATSAPIAALRGLLELLAYEPLNAVVDALGENAENPTFDELAAAIDQLRADGASDDDIVSLLAFAIAESFPAAAHCRRLLAEREAFTLPELPAVAATGVLATARAVDPAIKEQRRQRREEEKKKRAKVAPARPARPAKEKREVAPVTSPTTPATDATAPAPLTEDRRRVVLTPAEAERFVADHPLAGTVVVLDVPFDAVDPEQPDVKSKDRPALVVAVGADALLVRAIYSSEAPSRRLFGAWPRLGLDHASYIDEQRVIIATSPDDARARLGQLTTSEWNALF